MRSRSAIPALAAVTVAVPLAIGAAPAASAAVASGVLAAAPSQVSLVGGVALKAKAGVKAKPKKPKPKKFTVVGTIAEVDPAGSLTVQTRSGHKDLRNTTVTLLTTSTTKIRLNGVTATLDELAAGARVTANGTRSGTTYTAKVVNARIPVATPTPTPTPTPTDTPAPPVP